MARKQVLTALPVHALQVMSDYLRELGRFIKDHLRSQGVSQADLDNLQWWATHGDETCAACALRTSLR